MRVFENVREAAREIERDLAKSPLLTSTRVQNLSVTAQVREAMNYAYTIHSFPDDVEDYVELGVELGFVSNGRQRQDLTDWLERESLARETWHPGYTGERQHPALQHVLEGSEPSYTYTDRLRSGVESLGHLLTFSPDTRRGFWPIFHPEDAVRAVRSTRIPCSLGYQLTLRDVNEAPHLHMTYFMRSCDFRTFWFTDIWLAHRFQMDVLMELVETAAMQGLPAPKLGLFTHIVHSLHTFIDAEIY